MHLPRIVLLSIALLLVAPVVLPTASAQAPALQVEFTPKPAVSEAGTSGSISISMTNIGTTGLYRVEARPTAIDEPLEIIGDRFQAGGAAADQAISVAIPFKVPDDAPAGYYRVVFDMSYCEVGAGGSCGSFKATTLVEVRSTSELRVASISPRLLDVWGDETMEVVVENTGSSDLKSVSMEWATAQDTVLPIGGSNRIQIGGIEAGGNRTVEIPVATAPGIEPGMVAFTIALRATDINGNTLTSQSTVGIRIGGDTRFDVSAHMERSGSISVSIANIGVNPGSSATMRVWPDGRPESSAAVAFLGDLAGGDFTTMSFDSGRWGIGHDGDTRFNVQIDYTDGNGERKQSKHLTGMTTEGSNDEGGGSAGALLFWGALVVVGTAGTALYARKRRNERKHHEEQEDVEQEHGV